MKLFILAASVGYVLGAANGEDCGALNAGQADCVDTDYCDVAQTAAQYDSDGAGTMADEDAATTGKCATKPAGGAACTADTGCGTGYSCDATSSTCKGATGSACSAAVTQVVKGSTTPWSGQCTADTEGQATTCADGDNDANTANTCGGVACDNTNGADDGNGGFTCDDGAAGGACVAEVTADPPANVAAEDAVECATATDTCTNDVCTAGVGQDGGACEADVPAACTAEADTCQNGADGAAGGNDDFCGVTGGATGATALDGALTAGANGGACLTVNTGDDRCVGDLVATAVADTNDANVEASCTCGAASSGGDGGDAGGDDGAADDEDSAALFYGLSMVTGAIAYLL